VGRPTKLTPDRQARIIEALANGATRKAAAAYAVVPAATLWQWMEKGRRQCKGPYKAFHDAVESAEAKLMLRLVQPIVKAAIGGDWRAAEALLKRRFPDDFGDTLRIALRHEAERYAAEHGLDPGRIVEDAEAILAAAKTE